MKLMKQYKMSTKVYNCQIIVEQGKEKKLPRADI